MRIHLFRILDLITMPPTVTSAIICRHCSGAYSSKMCAIAPLYHHYKYIMYFSNLWVSQYNPVATASILYILVPVTDEHSFFSSLESRIPWKIKDYCMVITPYRYIMSRHSQWQLTGMSGPDIHNITAYRHVRSRYKLYCSLQTYPVQIYILLQLTDMSGPDIQCYSLQTYQFQIYTISQLTDMLSPDIHNVTAYRHSRSRYT